MKEQKDIRIAVICGGPGAEAEVSRTSARCIIKALRTSYSEVYKIELNQNVATALRKLKPDVAFPALHGSPGEDGTVQGLLEILGIPYVGSGVRASACAMDKILTKLILRQHNLPVADDAVIYKRDDKAKHFHYFKQLGSDVVIKPSSQGSALGISFAKTKKEFEKALAAAFAFDDTVLIERRIIGKEITAGVLERIGVEAFPVIEIRTPLGSWYDFKHRYTPGLSEHLIPASLPEKQYHRVQELACATHRALGCRDLSRVDFVVPKKGEPIIIEINTIPGMTPTSLYPDAALAHGISFNALVSHLIKRALTRAEHPNKARGKQ